ncbi:transposase [Streptomyces sp. NPDC006475]|uniref:transposase n=1 Tax=Streptomyces sp. NPDC006475 TaxID=3155719 RepID=UPI0033AEE6F6
MSDELWLLVEPLLPEPALKLVEGRARVQDRQALCGSLFVLHTGLGSGMTCWRRLAARNDAGVWDHCMWCC